MKTYYNENEVDSGFADPTQAQYEEERFREYGPDMQQDPTHCEICDAEKLGTPFIGQRCLVPGHGYGTVIDHKLNGNVLGNWVKVEFDEEWHEETALFLIALTQIEFDVPVEPDYVQII